MSVETQNVLFLVTGMTPAIITETVWALACDPQLDEESRWIPDRIEVLSTQHGLNQIRSLLLEKKIFERFKQDFPQIANIEFSAKHMHCIRDGQGAELIDLKTPADNEQAADQINEHIRQLARDPNTCLHVSIAGGRKTMGFYAGYALSLHGRAQDRMSHVLVSEQYESIKDFFYPTPEARYVSDAKGIQWDASKAQVWLAEIPFVRMKDAILEKHQLNSDDSFSEVVNKIKSSFSPISLTINLDSNRVLFNEVEVTLPPREFAFLHWFADLRRQGLPGIRCPRVKNTDKGVRAEDANYVTEITELFKDYYGEQKSSGMDELSVDKTFFNTAVSNIKTQLISQLGLETAAKFQISSHGKRGEPFYLDIPANSITIIDTMK